MTDDEKITTPEDMAKLVRKNKAENKKRKVTFVGGGADGFTMLMPDGTVSANVQVMDGKNITYYRSARNDLEFLPYHDDASSD